jgi:sec-independent protein translocase protein TatA
MFGLGYQELVVLLIIVLVLFGANRVPKLARALGESFRELRDGLNATKEEPRDKDRA